MRSPLPKRHGRAELDPNSGLQDSVAETARSLKDGAEHQRVRGGVTVAGIKVGQKGENPTELGVKTLTGPT